MTDVYVDSADVVVEVKQPTVPPAAKPPNIGLVEISQVVQRGSAWMTGSGAPSLPGGQYGDMYLDVDTGDMYLWNGAEWVYQGTFAPATLTPEEILAMLITVDGAGSGVDADLLDGQHGAYYAKQSDMDTQTATNTAQDTQLANHELRISGNETNITDLYTRVDAADAGQTPAAILTKIKTVDGPGSGLDADTLDGHDTAYFLAATDYNAADVLTKLKTVDGTGSGLDADLLDGETGADYHDLSKATGTINDAKHGNLGGGNLHALATASARGFMVDAPSDTKQYVRKDAAWQEVSVPPGTYVGLTPPANPPDNQMWMKSDTGALYLYFNDQTSKQWIQVSASPQFPGAGKTADTNNLLVNPSMRISQENSSSAGSSVGYYPVDQWAMFVSGATCSAQWVITTQSPEGGWRIKKTVTTPKASLASGDYSTLMQSIEGTRIFPLKWGSTDAKQLVARIGLKGPAGTYSLAIRNTGTINRSYVKNFTISAGEANTDVVRIFVIPGDITGTWDTSFAAGISFAIFDAVGSTYQGVEGWQAGDIRGTAANTNLVATNGNVVELFDCGLYCDSDKTGLPPKFEMQDYDDDLRDCLRYYERSYRYVEQGYQAASNNIIFTKQWFVQKRATPTCSYIFTNNLNAVTPSIGNPDIYGFTQTWVKDSNTGVFNVVYQVAASARM